MVQSKRPNPEEVEVGWEEGLRWASCIRTKSKSGETRIKNKKEKEDKGSLPDSQPSAEAVNPWKSGSTGQRSNKGMRTGWKERLREALGRIGYTLGWHQEAESLIAMLSRYCYSFYR